MLDNLIPETFIYLHTVTLDAHELSMTFTFSNRLTWRLIGK